MGIFFYISTNEIWSGSEELWVRSATAFAGTMPVEVATGYDHPQIENLRNKGIQWFDLNARYRAVPFMKRMGARLHLNRLPAAKDLLKEKLKQLQPSLVILSQGNNIGALPYMELCGELGIPYVTVTQLVSEVHWLWINDSSVKALREAYTHALANYFVSKANLLLNTFMIGTELKNTHVVFNPASIALPTAQSFLPVTEIWDIAAVGRLECFHKGYDLLIQVMQLEKWRNRPLKITFFGDGPHKDLLKRFAEQHKLYNLHFAGHTGNIQTVWNRHHLLILPSRMEGQSLALIEAMYCYRGVICTNVGGAAELVEDGFSGFIASSATIESIDECLERAWEKRSQWQQIGLNAGKAIRDKYPADPVAWFNKQLENACS